MLRSWLCLIPVILLMGCARKVESPRPWHDDPVLVDRLLRTALEAGHMSEVGLSAYTVSVWEAGAERFVSVVRERPDGSSSTTLLRYETGIGLKPSGEPFREEPGLTRCRIGAQDFTRVYSATGFKTGRSPMVPLP